MLCGAKSRLIGNEKLDSLRKVSGAVIYVHFAPHSAAFEQVAALYEAITSCVVDEYGAKVEKHSKSLCNCSVLVSNRRRHCAHAHVGLCRALGPRANVGIAWHVGVACVARRISNSRIGSDASMCASVLAFAVDWCGARSACIALQ